MKFYKLVATGNDFIIVDNRDGVIKKENYEEISKKLLRRRFSVGGDGMIFLERDEEYDFSWAFYNPDGSRAEMCGNGARCAARLFFFLTGRKSCVFRTDVGVVEAKEEDGDITISMGRYHSLKLNLDLPLGGEILRVHFVNTGVPHTILFVDNLDDLDVKSLGRSIRHHPFFHPSGTNVDFLCIKGNKLYMRTYERGVEEETWACGTGACAAACVSKALGIVEGENIPVFTKGGLLYVKFSDDMLFLKGEAKLVYEGKLYGG